jgi:hypothetical protein
MRQSVRERDEDKLKDRGRVTESTNCIASDQKKCFGVESFSLNGLNDKLYYSLLLRKVILQIKIFNEKIYHVS